MLQLCLEDRTLRQNKHTSRSFKNGWVLTSGNFVLIYLEPRDVFQFCSWCIFIFWNRHLVAVIVNLRNRVQYSLEETNGSESSSVSGTETRYSACSLSKTQSAIAMFTTWSRIATPPSAVWSGSHVCFQQTYIL